MDSRLLARALTTAIMVAGVATAIAAFGYALSATLLIMIFRGDQCRRGRVPGRRALSEPAAFRAIARLDPGR
ncbi:MAG: hypothetical protein M3478_07300 [Planctomycetota bacterium]|nr:hypothetical protein [Planctomycetota bacterium]